MRSCVALEMNAGSEARATNTMRHENNSARHVSARAALDPFGAHEKQSILSHASFHHREKVTSSRVHESVTLVYLDWELSTVLVGCIINGCRKTTLSAMKNVICQSSFFL